MPMKTILLGTFFHITLESYIFVTLTYTMIDNVEHVILNLLQDISITINKNTAIIQSP